MTQLPYNQFSRVSSSADKTVTEDYLRTHFDELDIDTLCMVQTLSESFIRDFQDDLNWKLIFKYQNLSDEFRAEFADKIN